MFHTQSAEKGHIRAKQNIFLLQVKILIHYSINIPPLRIENLKNMKLNELGRQKLGRQKLGRQNPCKQAQHAQLYFDLKRKPLIALGSHQWGP